MPYVYQHEYLTSQFDNEGGGYSVTNNEFSNLLKSDW